MDSSADFRQHVTSRWLEYEGELRVGMLRVCLITIFYGAQLVSYLSLKEATATDQWFQRMVTYLCAAWLCLSLAVLTMLARHWLPSALKYLISGLDWFFLTVMATAGSGPASPLVILYLLLIVLSGMRGNLKMIWLTTGLSVGGYGWLLWLHGQFTDAVPMPSLMSVTISAHVVKPVSMMVVTLAMIATGIVTGQLVRMLRQIVAEVCLRPGQAAQMDTKPTTISEAST